MVASTLGRTFRVYEAGRRGLPIERVNLNNAAQEIRDTLQLMRSLLEPTKTA